jgi:hypothetical protein
MKSMLSSCDAHVKNVILLNFVELNLTIVSVKGKVAPYRPEQAQRMDRGIALPFRDLGARRG